MYANPGGGLGFWSTLIAVGAKVGADLLKDDSLPIDVYYPDALRGVIHCPGPFNVTEVANQIATLDLTVTDPVMDRSTTAARLRADILSMWQLDPNAWGSSGMFGQPDTPLEKAGALVAWAHGGRDCKMTADDERAREILNRLLAWQPNLTETLVGRRQREELEASSASILPSLPGLPDFGSDDFKLYGLPLLVAGAAALTLLGRKLRG